MEEEDRCVVIVEAAEGAVCVRCLLSCRLEESHERVCAGCYELNLGAHHASKSTSE